MLQAAPEGQQRPSPNSKGSGTLGGRAARLDNSRREDRQEGQLTNLEIPIFKGEESRLMEGPRKEIRIATKDSEKGESRI